MVVWRWTKAVVLFLVDYIFGDDWTVAALIALGLLATWRLVEAGAAAWWLLPRGRARCKRPEPPKGSPERRLMASG